MTRTPIIKQRHDWPDADARIDAAEPDFEIAAPASIRDLEFTPQPMVAWFSPKELFVAGFRAVVSSIFGAYADKREIESVLAPGEWQDYSDYLKRHGEIWIDYVADLGDGWSPTYAIARLLAEEELVFSGDFSCNEAGDRSGLITERGKILIMGGDQVYPTASLDEYRNRLIGPYRSALPGVRRAEQAPHLYAVPGNHDWYDGLSSFFQLFCNRRWIGGWKTRQLRSYFALKLTEQLWVWGIDIQLNANIDQPQLDYFDSVAAEMAAGSDIILCTAEPSWAYVEMHTRQEASQSRRDWQKEREYKNLGYLQNRVAHKYGHEFIVGLAGDTHNYARYEADDAGRQQRFVSGGGGAYLYPTHEMPDTLEIPPKFGGDRFHRQAVYPDADKSKSLVNKCLLFPFFRQNWSFSAVIGSFYLLLAWVVQSVSKIAAGSGDTFLERLASNFDLMAFIRVLAHSPISVTFLLVLLASLVMLSEYRNAFAKIAHGGLHTLAHIGVFLVLMYAIARVNLGSLDLDVDGWRQVVLFGFEMLLLGSMLGGMVFGLYLWISNRVLGLHANEALLCQSSPDYKNFLRFHIRDNGTVAIYAVGVAKVPRKTGWSLDPVKRRLAGWSLKTDAEPGAAWFEPDDGPVQKYARLIEKPVTITTRKQAADSLPE